MCLDSTTSRIPQVSQKQTIAESDVVPVRPRNHLPVKKASESSADVTSEPESS